MDYSTISANCDAGMLVNWDSPEKSSDMNLVLSDGSALYWSPMDKDGNVVPFATISFTVVRDNKTTYLGNLHIESSGDSDFDGRWIYNAFLSRTEMYLSPNLENEGAIISETASMTRMNQIRIRDLSQGALEIPIEELDEYAFRTNSTKISVTVLSEQVLITVLPSSPVVSMRYSRAWVKFVKMHLSVLPSTSDCMISRLF